MPAPQAKLEQHIDALLSGSLGSFPKVGNSNSPVISVAGLQPFTGLLAGLLYAALFCGLPWLFGKPSMELFWLSIWGACYFAFAATIARSTSASVLELIRTNILPGLSDEAAIAIDQDLTRRFRNGPITLLSVAIAVCAAAISGFAISHDLKLLYCDSSQSTCGAELVWWCIGYFILYFASARTTFVARFYGTFAAHMNLDQGRLYPLDPARSLHVSHVAMIGKKMLLFWFGILCSVLTLLLFFYHLTWFILFVVPTASLCSLGFGSFIFLSSERNIHRTVAEVLGTTIRSAEQEIAALFSRRDALNEPEWTRLRELTALHKQLSLAGSYRSLILSGISLLGPFVVPVVSLAIQNWPQIKSAFEQH